MKQYLLLFILSLCIYSTTYSQEVEYVQKVEYSTIYLKIYYQTNLIKYDRKGLSKSPLLSMPDGKTYILEDYTDKENPKEFIDLNQVLNYMAGYGWSLVSSNIAPYAGDGGNTDKGIIINTNEYIQILLFVREKKTE